MSEIVSSYREVLPFNPFKMLEERRIPLRKLNNSIDEIETENSGEESVESGETKEPGSYKSESSIEQETDTVLILDKRDEKLDLDRDTILDRLKQNQKFVTYCESSSQSIIDVVPEPAVEHIDLTTKEPSVGRKLDKQIQISEEEPTELNLLREPVPEYKKPDEKPFLVEESKEIKIDDKTVFIVCFGTSSVDNKPGKGAGESMPETRKIEFERLGAIPQWRQKLCNDYIGSDGKETGSGFTVDGRKWVSVTHFMMYSKYKNNTDTKLIETLYDYEKAQEIEKTGKWNGKKIKIDLDFDSRKHQDMYRAVFAKFTQNIEMARLLLATKDATIMIRITSHKKEMFYELLSVRDQLEPMRKSLEIGIQGPMVPIPKLKKGKKETIIIEEDASLIQKTKLGKWADRLPPMDKTLVKASSYYMNNRKLFITKINQLFDHYRAEIQEETKREESGELVESSNKESSNTKTEFGLLIHQRVVRDYLNLYSPYRGLLLYHGLGSGKTCTSIAIAEGMKTEKRIFVMMPASLKTNYWSELLKCGDHLYKKNQYWEFLSIEGKPELIPIFAKALGLKTADIREKKGAWMVDINKPANFSQFSPDKQAEIESQIQIMINRKYTDLHYNAPNLKKLVNGLIQQTSFSSGNPFDHSVVIIDEAHNFVSRIINKLKKPDSVFYQLYHLLMDAQDMRIVFLSGTPIINYPNEMGVLFNLLRGYIKTWTFQLKIQTTEKIDRDRILKMFSDSNFHTYDFVDYTRNTLTITRNPFGFINTSKSAAPTMKPKTSGGFVYTIKKHSLKQAPTRNTRKQTTISPYLTSQMGGSVFKEYKGVKLNERGDISDFDFITMVKRILTENNILVESGYPKLKREKTLPDQKDVFQKTFIKNVIQAQEENDLLNTHVLQNRILGLTSYFRSAQEKLLPTIIKTDIGENYHNILVDMSDYQFAEYARIRKDEYESEKKSKKAQTMQRASGANTEELFNVSSSYRIFSRACCNFAFPDPPGRPVPNRKSKKGEAESAEEDEGLDEEDLDGYSEDNEDETKGQADNYGKRLESAMDKLQQNAAKFFLPEGLKQYSPKFLEILNRIQDPLHEGLHLLYSNFRTLEGIGILKMVLEANNMAEFKIQNVGGKWELINFDLEENAGKSRFVLYTGTESEEQKEIVRNIYNGTWENVPAEIVVKLRAISSNNLYGEIIKLFMITSAGAEGINLKNTRYVHIVEPYWHMVRLEQVVGRARRIGSHMELPEELRTVQVFVYLSVMSASQKTNEKYKEIQLHDTSRIYKNKPVTTDENLYEISVMKHKINQQFLMLIKRTAMDCQLYVGKHNKQEPLVCYGYGKVLSNEFSSYPTIEMDMETAPEQNERIKMWKGRELQFQKSDKKYVLNPGTNEVYDFESYQRAIQTQDPNALILEGRLVMQLDNKYKLVK